MAPHPEIDGRSTQLQVAQDDLVEEFGQIGVAQADLAFDGVELQAQRGLKQRKWRRAGPGLRRAGNGKEGKKEEKKAESGRWFVARRQRDRASACESSLAGSRRTIPAAAVDPCR